MEPIRYSLNAVGSEVERAIIIGSEALDAKIAEQEHVYERN